MAAPKHNLTIDQGSDFVFDLVVSESGLLKTSQDTPLVHTFVQSELLLL